MPTTQIHYELPRDSRSVPIQVLQPLRTRSVLASADSALNIDNFSPGIEVVRIVSTEHAYIEFGEAGLVTSANTGMFIPAGVVEYYRLAPGQVISLMSATNSGLIYVSEMY